MNTFSLVFVAAIIVNVCLHVWLCRRHVAAVRRHRGTVPVEFNGQISLEDHQKAADYTIAQTRFGQYELLVGFFLLVLWTLGGGLDLLDSAWRGLALPDLVTGVAVMVSVFAIIGLLDLPTSLYQTFVIEQRFGFNRTTLKVFINDLLKQAAITALIGIPLSALVLWLMQGAGKFWWLYVWLTWIALTLFMSWAHPTFIAPLFNKFRPLKDADLRHRIESLLKRNGFSSNGIYVMDGSLRSTHGNAYFTGFGANKRIVFFDTLIDELSPSEIESVLAHELGHFKRKHVFKKLFALAALSLIGLALLGWLINQPWFYTGLGISQPSVHTALLLFLMASPVFTIFLQPIMAHQSRKYEFEADDFASEQSESADLIRALVKLYKENAKTLTPDPLYSAFHDSHPPAPVRIAHLAASSA